MRSRRASSPSASCHLACVWNSSESSERSPGSPPPRAPPRKCAPTRPGLPARKPGLAHPDTRSSLSEARYSSRGKRSASGSATRGAEPVRAAAPRASCAHPSSLSGTPMNGGADDPDSPHRMRLLLVRSANHRSARHSLWEFLKRSTERNVERHSRSSRRLGA